jgi:beta-lactamase class A
VSLERELKELCSGFSGVAGAHVENMTTREIVSVRGDESFPTASAIKVFVLYCLFRSAEHGDLELDERVTLSDRSRILGSGVLLHLDAGLCPTLRDLGTLMMMVSDNTATNLLIDRLGASVVNRAIRTAGLEHTELRGPVDFTKLAQDKSAFGVSTPSELAGFFANLRRGKLLGPDNTKRVLSVLRIQKYIEPLRRKLPTDPYAGEFGDPEPVWVASKTGSLTGVRCEAGLVHTPKAEWSIAVMTKDGTDTRVTSDNEGWQLVSRVSRLIYDRFS